MEFKTIIYEKKGPIGILRLNRPETRNAINSQMLDELKQFFNERLQDYDTRVLILEGAGKLFCSGADIKEPAIKIDDTLDLVYSGQMRYSEIILLMRKVPQPIIAAIHGPAIGAGFSVAMACDIRIATDKATFSAAFINIGLSGSDMGSSYFFPRQVGLSNASRYLLTGDTFDAVKAEKMGLISEIVSEDKLTKTVMKIAETMCTKSTMGLRVTKEAINMNVNAGSIDEAIKLEDRNQTITILEATRFLRNQSS